MPVDNPYTDDQNDQKAALEMDEIARTIFAPIYPVIAEQIKATHGITAGTCIDLGAGPCALSIALARMTDLRLFAVDKSPHSHAIAMGNVKEQGLENRITPVKADISNMPFEDNYADLMVSRGSVFFWEDLVSAFNEIYRVLKPGGKTHIGGGFGTVELKNAIFEKMAQKKDGFEERSKKRGGPENMKRIKTALDESLAGKYKMTQSDIGFWIHIKKELAS
ncbi:MAG: class I SAM-dependent methyltransferase [Proteobacteria bacterium]|nr:class I SAM-dependent methyltransferase [Pseudomonadota bacterium]MBU1583106.1 class I SAM-dependent methyltransferase [Pseudomonadota bacterium]MBU2455695.1 class I SAM-dependent methyltransferase [Pseudomonadota bacterium]MBU2629371.1 class I SAM-dependent methyltransferase [Pseudomonadota bacterium]